jgi:hypothetical protein
MSDLTHFSKIDADRILRRAAEIEGSHESRSLSLAELRSIADEAGFGNRALELAIAEAQQAAYEQVRYHPVRKSGLIILDLSTIRSIPIQLTSEQVMRAVRLFQPYREGPAQVKLEEHQITWRDKKGIRFTVVAGGGETEIRVQVSRLTLRRGRWISWVKDAADRLETLAFMVVQGTPPRAEALPPGHPQSD